MSNAETPSAQTQPLLRVLTPNTTAEEVAAIVAVLASLGGSAQAPRKPRSAWASPARQVRGSMAPGASGWRLSGLPRG
ncbi:MAG: hypothetical protein NVSMB48_08990 [Marmoricola sp.]